VGTAWAFFWFAFGSGIGGARWLVGALGIALVAGARIMLQTKGAAALDVSHMRLELATPTVRRGGRAQVTLSVLEPEKVRGQIDVTVACAETYAYRVDSDRGGSSRRDGTNVLWRWPTVVEPRPAQPIAFDLPAHLPFSWDGDYVKYTWTVTATERVEHGLDPTIELSLRVLP
jgi:hypothetical protein